MASCEPIKYLPASYNGIPFEILSSDDDFSKGNWSFEYPMSDGSSSTDTGWKAAKHTINGYINGSDHVASLAALKLACGIRDLGLLVHPIWGAINVRLLSFKPKHDFIERRGESEFSLEFIEAGNLFGGFSLGLNATSVVNDALSVLSIASQVSFLSSWVATPFTYSVATLSSDITSRELSPIVGKEWLVYDKLSQASLWGSNPSVAIAAISSALPIIAKKSLPVERLKRIASFSPSLSSGSSKELMAIDGLYSTLSLVSVANIAILSVKEKYKTVNQAWDRLEYIIKVLDQESLIASKKCDTRLVRAIHDARAKISRAILSEAVKLPSLGEFDLTMQMPSLIAAHKLYGDSSRAVDLENYNPTQNVIALGYNIFGLNR